MSLTRKWRRGRRLFVTAIVAGIALLALPGTASAAVVPGGGVVSGCGTNFTNVNNSNNTLSTIAWVTGANGCGVKERVLYTKTNGSIGGFTTANGRVTGGTTGSIKHGSWVYVYVDVMYVSTFGASTGTSLVMVWHP